MSGRDSSWSRDDTINHPPTSQEHPEQLPPGNSGLPAQRLPVFIWLNWPERPVELPWREQIMSEKLPVVRIENAGAGGTRCPKLEMLCVLAATFLALGFAPPPASLAPADTWEDSTPAEKLKMLEGDWEVVKQEWNGKPVSDSEVKTIYRICRSGDATATFSPIPQPRAISYSYFSEIDTRESPVTLDRGADVMGMFRHRTWGICRVDGDRLTICSGVSGVVNRGTRKPGPRPTSFTADSGSDRGLLLLRRVKPGEEPKTQPWRD
jgi:uncharacterized protein (TIGR03067 family)